jgi:hypothetical protein
MVNDASTKVNDQSTKVNSEVRKVANELIDTGGPLQTLAKAGKLTVTAERADGGKLRCTCATWDDAVVILAGEALTIVNIDRQAHALRTKAPGSWTRGTSPVPGVRQVPWEGPTAGTMPFGAPPDEGGRHPPISVRTISGPLPTRGRLPRSQ